MFAGGCDDPLLLANWEPMQTATGLDLAVPAVWRSDNLCALGRLGTLQHAAPSANLRPHVALLSLVVQLREEKQQQARRDVLPAQARREAQIWRQWPGGWWTWGYRVVGDAGVPTRSRCTNSGTKTRTSTNARRDNRRPHCSHCRWRWRHHRTGLPGVAL